MPEQPAVPRPPGRFAPAAVIALTAVVFGAGLAFITWQLRLRLHEQVLLREGESLSSVAAMQLANNTAEMAELGLAEVPGDMLSAVLKTSRLRGVLAIRVLDQARQSAFALPWLWTEAPPAEGDWVRLAEQRPIARLRQRSECPELAGVIAEPAAGDGHIPLLEVWVPLRRTDKAPLEGAAQFWIDGAGVAAECTRIDASLAIQSGLAWLAGTLVITVALGVVFKRLEEAKNSLEEHSKHLEKANRELLLAAKTSALGAVTAHLIHELKNPIAGLESLVASATETGVPTDNRQEMAAAAEIASRLRGTVNEVVALLHDEERGTPFELSGLEIAEVATAKVGALADARRIEVNTRVAEAGQISGRRANLAVLVLQNLLKNAIEASADGANVRLASATRTDGGLEFLVEDDGPGLPEAIRRHLFQPCRSTKAGGTGIGLALCQQLAQRANGTIELVRSDSRGTCFRLVLLPEV